MNTGSDIFSSPRQEEETNESLTQRLYARSGPLPETLERESTQSALEELRRLAAVEPLNRSKTSEFRKDNGLEQHIQTFQEEHTKLLKDYFDLPFQRSGILDYGLYELTGWKGENPMTGFSILTEEARKSSGGHYVRWKGKGIVLNPGPGFIDSFHQRNFCIHDIDFVIVTRNNQEVYGDIKKIYEMNNEWNKHSSENHIIRYYLQQNAYQELASGLKPNFRNARHTVHSLETFLDSPDVENIDLDLGIRLFYFQTPNQEDSPLGVRLELSDPASQHLQGRQGIRLGYLSGMGWSPHIAHHLGRCDVLLAGFGNTNPDDYSLLSYNEDSLGYYGTFSLFEEISPYLLLLTEFSGREGDLRIEATKKIRQDVGRAKEVMPIALPGDVGLVVDLLTFHVQCSISQNFVDPAQVRIVKTQEDFGKLQYLSPCFCL